MVIVVWSGKRFSIWKLLRGMTLRVALSAQDRLRGAVGSVGETLIKSERNNKAGFSTPLEMTGPS